MPEQLRFPLSGLFLLIAFIAINLAFMFSLPDFISNPISLLLFMALLSGLVILVGYDRGTAQCFSIGALVPMLMAVPMFSYDLFWHLRTTAAGPMRQDFYGSDMYERIVFANLAAIVCGLSGLAFRWIVLRNCASTKN